MELADLFEDDNEEFTPSDTSFGPRSLCYRCYKPTPNLLGLCDKCSRRKRAKELALVLTACIGLPAIAFVISWFFGPAVGQWLSKP